MNTYLVLTWLPEYGPESRYSKSSFDFQLSTHETKLRQLSEDLLMQAAIFLFWQAGWS